MIKSKKNNKDPQASLSLLGKDFRFQIHYLLLYPVLVDILHAFEYNNTHAGIEMKILYKKSNEYIKI